MSRDSSFSPKLYSHANNMDPGEVPPHAGNNNRVTFQLYLLSTSLTPVKRSLS